MSDWILLVHLGPVQDFIASARRCRDLWYGSKLLSFLARRATQAMVEASGLDEEHSLIFPGQIKDAGSVANKVQLQLKSKSEADVKAIAEAGREGMLEALLEVGEDVYDGIEERLNRADRPKEDFDRNLAESQLKDLMEFMWVAVPFEESGYVQARKTAERLLAGRKNARNWKQVPEIEAGRPKSSLDGIRESALNDMKVFGDARRQFEAYPPNDRRKIFGVSGAERLCGVGLIKRNGRDPDAIHNPDADDEIPVFHSAAHIASAGVRARLTRTAKYNTAVQNHWIEYLDALKTAGVNLNDHRIQSGGEKEWRYSLDTGSESVPRVLPRKLEDWNMAQAYGFDGGLLYESRHKTLLENEVGRAADPVLKGLKDKLNTLLSKIDAKDPYPYFAMILADGDKMGIALDGMTSPAQHKKFSHKLEQEFAAKALEIVERHGGSLIYSGGDDVLAIVPVCTVLDCSRALKAAFDDAMDGLGLGAQVPTLSVGIAIAHFLEPFANVRGFAKEAEAAAKNKADRNALAILVKKRGGVPKLMYGKWGETTPPDERIKRWARLQREGKLPRGFAYHIEDIADSFGPKSQGDETSKDVDFVRSLVKRVIKRRNLNDKNLEERFVALFEAYIELTKTNKGPQPYEAVRRFSEEFQIAAEFRKAFDEIEDNFEDKTKGAAE